MFVSIHLNKIPQQQYDGWQTFYKQGSEEGKKLAISIQNNLNEAIQKENNRVAKTIENIYIIKSICKRKYSENGSETETKNVTDSESFLFDRRLR